jgi:cytochrome P450
MSSAPEAAVLAELDVTVPGFYLRPDYFEVLGWLRANARVRRSANGMWLVSTYEEIREISRQPERFSSRRGALVNDPVRLGEPNDDATIEVTDNPSDEVLGAIGEFFVFLDGHVRAKFDSPGDDLLSLLAASTVGDRPLPPEEVQMFCLTLVVAGNETTRSLLSGAALALAEHPDQRAALAADPDLLPGAI